MSGMDRRRFLKVTAITGTSAALAGCGNPEHQLMRFVPEEELTPGIAVWKPSVCPLCSAGCGVQARVMDGDAEVFRNGQPGDDPHGPAAQARRRSASIRSARAGCASAARPRCRSPITPIASPRRCVATASAAAAASRRSPGTTRSPIWPGASTPWSRKARPARSRSSAGRDAAAGRRWWRSSCSGSARRRRSPSSSSTTRSAAAPTRSASAATSCRPSISRDRATSSASAPTSSGTWNSPLAQNAGLRPHAPGPARPSGAKFVQIEPRVSQTGASADEWLAVRPGTEGAVALGLAHVILRDGLAAGVRRRPRRRARRRAGRPDCRRSRRPRWRSAPVSRRRGSSGWPASSRRIGRRWRSSAAPRWPTPTGWIRRWRSTR